MKIWTPRKEFVFEIDEKLIRSELGAEFAPRTTSYHSSGHSFVIALSEIYLLRRNVGTNGFRDEKSIRDILSGFKNNSTIPPIVVSTRNTESGYGYRLKDGFHRYYLSIAAGFTEIPVVINNFEMSDL